MQNLKISNERVFFTNGEDAFEYLVSTPLNPFLIISDMNMPRMNGLELREKVIANERLQKKATPFIFRAGSATESDINKTYEMSAQGFFNKTHDFNSLEKQLRLIIDYWSECAEPV